MAQEGDRVFPLGSIVVKEKLLRANDQLAIAVGMMIKRERGYNPDGNDWEYIYWESGGNIQRGLEQFGQCQFCHIGTNIHPEAEEFYSQIEDMQVSREARDSVFTILLVTPNP